MCVHVRQNRTKHWTEFDLEQAGDPDKQTTDPTSVDSSEPGQPSVNYESHQQGPITVSSLTSTLWNNAHDGFLGWGGRYLNSQHMSWKSGEERGWHVLRRRTLDESPGSNRRIHGKFKMLLLV